MLCRLNYVAGFCQYCAGIPNMEKKTRWITKVHLTLALMIRYVKLPNALHIYTGFPLFRTDKIPWYFHDFSRFLSKFPGIFFIIFKVWFPCGFEYKYANLLSFIWTKNWSFQLYSKLVNLPFYFSNLVNFVLFQGNQGWIFSSHKVFPGFM